MNVPSLIFLAMSVFAAMLFRLSARLAWRQGVLLVVNLGFFATFLPAEPMACLPFGAFLLLGYVALYRTYRPWVGWLLVTALIAMFFWLKRYSFIPNMFLLPFPYVIIGLSYVFFRVLHLAIDTQQAAVPTRPGLVSYLNYALNFTCLVSGPIQRYEDYHAMEVAPLPLGIFSLGESVERIAIGFFKVFVMSAALSAIQQNLIDGLAADLPFLPRLGTCAAIIAIYPVYLYFNFSGYTDFVIGVARWFGLVLPKNFNRPFQAENFISFWSCWHITLSGWLKTYVYQPLLMILMTRWPAQRHEPAIVVFVLFVTFFLVGAWHGQTGAFLFFGVLQGLGVGINRLYQMEMTKRLGRKPYRALCVHAVYRSCARGLTFTWFSFTLLWFWADWHQLGQFAAASQASVAILVWIVLFLAATIVLAAWKVAFDTAFAMTINRQPLVLTRYVRVVWNTALVAVVAGIIILFSLPAPPIVYKNF